MSSFKEVPEVRIKPFSSVYISTGNGKIKYVLKRGFDALGGIEKQIKPGLNILIKINLVEGHEAISGGITDVHLCEALVELLKEHCAPASITVGEQTSTGEVTKETFQSGGWVDMCRRQEIALVDFEDGEYVDVPLKDAMYADVISVSKAVLDADFIISLPLLKNHDTVCITGVIKNSFGFISDADRRQAHRVTAIEQYITDIARVRTADFAIVDGRIGMEGIAGGSHFDHPRYANRIVMGADPVAVDTVCAHIMAQNPRVRYLQWCDEYGLGNCNLDYVDIKGMTLEEARVPFMTPAEEIEELTGGQLHLIDLNSCSFCRAVAQGTLHRFDSQESVLTKVDIVYGPGDWEGCEAHAEKCILVGDCIQERYRALGKWIPGCPMERDDYLKELKSMNIVCSRCAGPVKEFVSRHTAEELAFVRILAANQTVFRGAENEAGDMDCMIAVGECEHRYYWRQIDRCREELIKRGLDKKYKPEDFLVFIPGHKATADDIEKAFQKLKSTKL